MSFSDCFGEFHEIEVDEHIRLRRHIPERDAEAFFRIYSDRDAFRFHAGRPPEEEMAHLS